MFCFIIDPKHANFLMVLDRVTNQMRLIIHWGCKDFTWSHRQFCGGKKERDKGQ